MQRIALVQHAHQAQHLGPVLARWLAFIASCSAWIWRVPLAFNSATASSALSGWWSSTNSSMTVIRRAVFSERRPACSPARRRAALVLAHAVRGARADQRCQAGVLGQFGGARGGLFGMAEAAFEQRLERLAQARLPSRSRLSRR